MPGDNLKLSINAQARAGRAAALAALDLDNRRHRRRVRRDGSGERPDLRDGLGADLQPEHRLARSISAKELDFLSNPDNNQPLINRAIDGAGPDGSTFKVITATAALESGDWSLQTSTYDDNGEFCFPARTDAPVLPAQLRRGAYGVGRPAAGDPGLGRRFFYNLGDS